MKRIVEAYNLIESRGRVLTIPLFLLTLIAAIMIPPTPGEARVEDFESHNWRWAYDDGARPTDRSGGDDRPITVKFGGTGAQNPVVRLRHVIVDDSGRGLTNASITYQYTTDSRWRSNVFEVGEPGSTNEKWRFRDSVHKNQMDAATGPALNTSHTPLVGKYLETAAESSYNHPANRSYYEMDSSLEYIGNETKTYYFRMLINNYPIHFDSNHGSQGPRINTVATSTPSLSITGHNWRWAYDDGASPSDRSGADDTPIMVKSEGTGANNPVLRLRYVLTDINSNGVSNASVTLQYTTDPTWQSAIEEVGETDSAGPLFAFRNSPHLSQLAATSAPMLNSAHSPQPGKTVEEVAETGLDLPADSGYYEMDFSLVYKGNETATYYFRVLIGGFPISLSSEHAGQGPQLSTNIIPKWYNANWRWAFDDGVAPTDRSKTDDNPTSVRVNGSGAYNPLIRLRHVLFDQAGVGVSNVPITYQYTTDRMWLTNIQEVGAPGSTDKKWRFRDSGYVTHMATASAPMCQANSPSAGLVIERADSNGFSYPGEQVYWEMDVSLEYIGDETATYFFRAVVGGKPAHFMAADGEQGATVYTEISTAGNDPDQATLPHGGFSSSTNKCVNCHRPHNAPGFRLLFARPGDYDTIAGFCFTCHKDGAGANNDVYYGIFRGTFTGQPGGGDLPDSSGWGTPGAGLNGGGFYYAMTYEKTGNRMGPTDSYGQPNPQPITSRHDALGGPDEMKTVWGSDPGPGSQIGLQCISCHIPHGSTNYRILRDKLTPVGGQPFPVASVKSHESQFGGTMSKSYTTIAYKAGIVRFCTSCHLHYAASVGTSRSPTEAYDAGDGWGSVVRHRHNEDMPLSNWTWWAENNAGYLNGNIANNLNDPDHFKVPVEQDTYSTTYSQDNRVVCLTCHQAHGTIATMTDEDRIGPASNSEWSQPGFAFLQRLSNRAVCENCHDWWHDPATGEE